MNIELKSVNGGALIASVEDGIVSICDANGERLKLPLGEVRYLARLRFNRPGLA